ncbi:hypothetical protein SNE40_000967 [Patella caerulea]|uniref:Uncharacterized protein n=1 Tax=Patella caerulea TaxID=87958 RepID=A0AAN8KG94_PATCE
MSSDEKSPTTILPIYHTDIHLLKSQNAIKKLKRNFQILQVFLLFTVVLLMLNTLVSYLRFEGLASEMTRISKYHRNSRYELHPEMVPTEKPLQYLSPENGNTKMMDLGYLLFGRMLNKLGSSTHSESQPNEENSIVIFSY